MPGASSSSARSKSTNGSASTLLTPAAWPAACPPCRADAILSVSIGNSRLHWARHAGFDGDFSPTVFWKTSPPTTDKSDTLRRHLPDEILNVVYGPNSRKFSPATCMAFRATQRHPTIYLYLLSTNPKHAAYTAKLFHHLPVQIYQLDDFDVPGTYPGLGVDRVASLRAARDLFPHAPSQMVVDGGTALTYTSSTRDGKVQGGIGAGVKIKCRSMFEYTYDLPEITAENITSMVDACVREKRPLPMETQKGNTEPTILANILKETVLLLCNVMESWLKSQPQETTTASFSSSSNKSKHAVPTVVLTGGDASLFVKLLQPNHSYIIESDPKTKAFLETAMILENESNISPNVDPSKKFRIAWFKNLTFHGIQGVLLSNVRATRSKNADHEKLREELLGQRVAVELEGVVHYGCVSAVVRQDVPDNDVYSVSYDEDGLIDDVKIEALYDALSRYVSVGEKARTTEDRRLSLENKRIDSKEAVALLETQSLAIQSLLEKREAAKREKREREKQADAERKQRMEEVKAKQAAEAAAAAANEATKAAQDTAKPTTADTSKRKSASQRTAESPAAKKKKPKPVPEPTKESSDDEDEIMEVETNHPYVGRRVAKDFYELGEVAVFFGTIKEYRHSPNKVVWWVLYDDGDNEELFEEEVKEGFKYYEEKGQQDTASN